MKTLSKNKKQGPCGSFCFKYWLGAGCDDCEICDLKNMKNHAEFFVIDNLKYEFKQSQ